MKVSVLMCVYNGERYIFDAIDSILAQTFEDFEFLVIDDGSTDATKALLKKYDDKRIKVVHNGQNIGLTKSLNKGLELAQGTYIARMDADDVSVPERLESQVQYLDKHPEVDCVGTAIAVTDAGGTVMNVKCHPSDPELISFKLVVGNQLAHPSVMFRKDSIVAVGGYDEHCRYAQDFALWSKLTHTGHLLANLPQPLVQYRSHNESISGGPTLEAAYKCARDIIRNNIERCVPIDDGEFATLIRSMHKNTVLTWRDAYYLRSFWQRLLHSYLGKFEVSDVGKTLISSYVRHERKRIIGQYLRSFIK